MWTKYDDIERNVKLAQKVFERFPNETGITIVQKILKRILKVINNDQ